MGYFTARKPILARRNRIRAERRALAARADAGNAAFPAGDPAAFAAPPEPPPRPKVRRGVVIAAISAALFVLFGIITDISKGLLPG